VASYSTDPQYEMKMNVAVEKSYTSFWITSMSAALLNLTQSIVDGFNEEKFTLAVLIDFKKAYDSVCLFPLFG
jgi:hypothetical protein